MKTREEKLSIPDRQIAEAVYRGLKFETIIQRELNHRLIWFNKDYLVGEWDKSSGSFYKQSKQLISFGQQIKLRDILRDLDLQLEAKKEKKALFDKLKKGIKKHTFEVITGDDLESALIQYCDTFFHRLLGSSGISILGKKKCKNISISAGFHWIEPQSEKQYLRYSTVCGWKLHPFVNKALAGLHKKYGNGLSKSEFILRLILIFAYRHFLDELKERTNGQDNIIKADERNTDIKELVGRLSDGNFTNFINKFLAKEEEKRQWIICNNRAKQFIKKKKLTESYECILQFLMLSGFWKQRTTLGPYPLYLKEGEELYTDDFQIQPPVETQQGDIQDLWNWSVITRMENFFLDVKWLKIFNNNTNYKTYLVAKPIFLQGYPLGDFFIAGIYPSRRNAIIRKRLLRKDVQDLLHLFLPEIEYLVRFITTLKLIHHVVQNKFTHDFGLPTENEIWERTIRVFTPVHNAVEERILPHARKAAVAEIINRNYAHHIGAHVSPRATFDKVLARLGKKIGDLSNSKLAATIAQLITILDVYKDERNEFIANLNNEPFYQPSYLYQDVVLPFIENTLLMDNIAANEGIEYKNPDGLSTPRNQEGRGQIDPNTALNQLVIRVFVDKSLCSTDNTKDQVAPQRGAKNDLSACPDGYRELKAVYIFFDSNNNRVPKYDSLDLPYVREIRTLGEPFYDQRELTCNDILVSLPNPLAKHAFYSILENFIRNTAKHSYDPKKHSNKIVEIIIRVTNKGEGFYRIELTDSISCISNGKLAELRSKIKNTDILEGKDRGIADMKINACLLAGLGLTDKNMKSSLDVDIDSEGHLIYRFSLLKHKEVAVIGYNGEKKFEDKNAGFYDFSDLNEYSRCQVKNFRFAVVDCSTIDESSLKKLIHQLPYRLLLINASNDSEFVTLRRAVKVSKDVFAVESKETFLENCWKKWLDRFGENNLDMRIFFQQKRDEEPTQQWSNAINTLTNQAMSATVCYLDQGAIQPTNDLSEPNKYYILYDRHAKLAEKLKVNLLEKNFYEQIDKNSADFPLLFNARTEQKPFLFPYELAEAGLLKILILDERVAEASTDILGGYYDSILKNGFKKAGNNCRNSNNITRFDACWAAGIYIGTHISDKPLSREIDEKSNHYLKIKFEKEPSSSHIKIKGTTNFAQWGDKLQKDLGLRVDVMVIHRTKLKDLCDDWNSRSIDFLESLDVPKVIITTGGGVVDFVDPKKWQILPTNVIRDFVLSSSPAKLSLVRKIIS
jgi:hypothetical protein